MGKIISDQIGSVLVVTITNEAKRNCIDVAMEQPFYDALSQAESDASIRAVVITGAGDVAFCSGHDLTEVGRPGIKLMKPDPMAHPDLMSKPVIAAINGHCHAAGLMMALCCDLRIASENAVFGQPAAKTGGLPMGGQIWRLAQVLPRARAMEMMMTAEFLSAREAFEWGMVNRLVPQGQSKDVAVEIATKISRNSSHTIKAIKQGIRIYDRSGEEQFSQFEQETYLELKARPERNEGIRAFVEKRRPSFE